MRATASVLAVLAAVAYGMPAPGMNDTVVSAAGSSDAKLVVAHVIVGNTYPYTSSSWAADIALAHASGIDGFALNIGSDSWQADRIRDAYTAAQASGTDFKLFFSFDMSALPCSTADDAATLRNYVTTYAKHPSQLHVNGKAFVSTFAGESCTFGQSSVAAGWSSQFRNHPSLVGDYAVWFSPSFFVDPATYSSNLGSVLDGAFSFNSGWPISVDVASANSILASLGLTLANIPKSMLQIVSSKLAQLVDLSNVDAPYTRGLAALGSDKTYMAAASPWFFTHYSTQTYNKNWIYLADNHLYSKRWESLISRRSSIDIVQVVTWNDYGESHYLRDPGQDGAQPNSEAWVDGLSHAGWLDMTAYYAKAFKSGAYPAITEDKVYMWARPHARDAAAAQDGIGKPTNSQITQDMVWAIVFATAPADVTLATSASNTQVFSVPAGVTKLSVPISAGDGMRGTLTRNGQKVVDVQPSTFSFSGSPATYNYNAFVAYNAPS